VSQLTDFAHPSGCAIRAQPNRRGSASRSSHCRVYLTVRSSRRYPRGGARQPAGDVRRLLQALDQLLEEVQRVADVGVQEWAALATLDAIDIGEDLGMLWDDEAERRRAAVREAFGDVDRR
jgi:hypothetical protein